MITETTRDTKRKFSKHDNPAPETIPSLWPELAARASLAPVGEVIGARLLRARLLDGVLSWMLPEVLENLTTGETTI